MDDFRSSIGYLTKKLRTATHLPNQLGLAHHGFGLYLSEAGCYQITATMIADDGAKYTSQIVFEILDE